MLVAAENPLIIAGRAARTPAGLQSMIELAELLQAPVQDRRFRMNFPTRHPLYGSGNLRRRRRRSSAWMFRISGTPRTP